MCGQGVLCAPEHGTHSVVAIYTLTTPGVVWCVYVCASKMRLIEISAIAPMLLLEVCTAVASAPNINFNWAPRSTYWPSSRRVCDSVGGGYLCRGKNRNDLLNMSLLRTIVARFFFQSR